MEMWPLFWWILCSIGTSCYTHFFGICISPISFAFPIVTSFTLKRRFGHRVAPLTIAIVLGPMVSKWEESVGFSDPEGDSRISPIESLLSWHGGTAQANIKCVPYPPCSWSLSVLLIQSLWSWQQYSKYIVSWTWNQHVCWTFIARKSSIILHPGIIHMSKQPWT